MVLDQAVNTSEHVHGIALLLLGKLLPIASP